MNSQNKLITIRSSRVPRKSEDVFYDWFKRAAKQKVFEQKHKSIIEEYKAALEKHKQQITSGQNVA
jgi:hypothetical protein